MPWFPWSRGPGPAADLRIPGARSYIMGSCTLLVSPLSASAANQRQTLWNGGPVASPAATLTRASQGLGPVEEQLGGHGRHPRTRVPTLATERMKKSRRARLLARFLQHCDGLVGGPRDPLDRAWIRSHSDSAHLMYMRLRLLRLKSGVQANRTES